MRYGVAGAVPLPCGKVMLGEVIAEVLGGLAHAAAAAALHVGSGFVRWVAEAMGGELWDRWERRDEP